MKKVLCLLLCLLTILCLYSCKDDSLPLPQVSEGIRGELGVDANINEETIDSYLNRQDSVYRDMRMLIDEADFEAIGGDSYISGIVKGFEVVPFPYICDVTNLPIEVGSTYTGVTLFSIVDDEYVANYAESLDILKQLFPQDKTIFLMCGGGGYAGMMKKLLVSLGWDGNKIYNVGGYWYYKGKNSIDTTYIENNEVKHNFSLFEYHDIDFSSLTEIRKQDDKADKKEKVKLSDKFIEIHNVEELEQLESNNKTFALFVYLDNCSSCASFMPIVEEFIDANNIDIYAVKLSDIYRESNSVSDRLDYTPSIFLYVDGQVVSYLDPTSELDKPYYKTLENLSLWFSNYIDIQVIKSDTVNDDGDCSHGCSLLDE